ncbi:DUF4844 domain-containing protein [Undibacterium sp. RTI2.1]|uniref:DUF4844 domain-containing protein n=1 Tax=unclassified Undibacterium TaxID=2630295 RepID=UPI002B234155|nr:MULTISPECIES: DUF4844 domain-containing protein [unclassified Undibacterium]MEB0031593.1 DUF4844 domain-containing protein [Undibacterium sp. RTI2.1]MEB0117836.1 DUF4844 domain-containing protein [Undibacterium sp. RTI2.2]
MTFDPLSEVEDAALSIDDSQIYLLTEMLQSEKYIEFADSYDVNERERLTVVTNDLLSVLIEKIRLNPTKLFVLSEFKYALEKIENEDTEACESFGEELGKIMGILNIESSDGLLAFYLGF